MESTFCWIDYSQKQKDEMLDLIHLFDEKETRDELGIGSIRDAFADMLFPGTGTVQTRARYFLFVPWLYLYLEQRKTPSNRVASELRKKEVELINTLADSEDNDGTIGIQSRARLKRLPSNIYWLGLAVLGIRLFPGSQDQYYHFFDAFHKKQKNLQKTDDGEIIIESCRVNWHPGIPPPPDDFIHKSSLSLLYNEARYLRERIISMVPRSLMAFLADKGYHLESVDFPWQHPKYTEFPPHNRVQLEHARNFSEVINGAALLYNLMLAEKQNSQELIERYNDSMKQWARVIKNQIGILRNWNIDEFWKTVTSGRARIPYTTHAFVNAWLTIVLHQGHSDNLLKLESARSLISDRERMLKKGLARLVNQRALELWNGDAGTAQLHYRWRNAVRILTDITRAIEKEKSHA